MSARMLIITGTTMALLMGSPWVKESFARDTERLRGGEGQSERSWMERSPSSQYQTRSWERDQDRTSRDQFGRTSGQNDRGFQRDRGYERYLEERDRFRGDERSRFRGNNRQYRQNRGQEGYSARSEGNGRAQKLSGTLARFKGEYVVVDTRDGDRKRLHVNRKTLFDAGIERGDRIIAYVRSDGHAIAIRKDRGRKGEHYIQPGSSDRNDERRFRGRDDRSSFQDDFGRRDRRSDSGRYRP